MLWQGKLQDLNGLAPGGTNSSLTEFPVRQKQDDLAAVSWSPWSTTLQAESEFKRSTFILNNYHSEKVIRENEPLTHRIVSRRCTTYSSKEIGTGEINMQIRSEERSAKPEQEATWPSAPLSASWEVNVLPSPSHLLIQSTFIEFPLCARHCSGHQRCLNVYETPSLSLRDFSLTGESVRWITPNHVNKALWDQSRATSSACGIHRGLHREVAGWSTNGFCAHLGSIAASTGWERMLQNVMAWGSSNIAL